MAPITTARTPVLTVAPREAAPEGRADEAAAAAPEETALAPADRTLEAAPATDELAVRQVSQVFRYYLRSRRDSSGSGRDGSSDTAGRGRGGSHHGGGHHGGGGGDGTGGGRGHHGARRRGTDTRGRRASLCDVRYIRGGIARTTHGWCSSRCSWWYR